MHEMTEEELHQRIELSVKKAVREAVEKKRVLQKTKKSVQDAQSSTR